MGLSTEEQAVNILKDTLRTLELPRWGNEQFAVLHSQPKRASIILENIYHQHERRAPQLSHRCIQHKLNAKSHWMMHVAREVPYPEKWQPAVCVLSSLTEPCRGAWLGLYNPCFWSNLPWELIMPVHNKQQLPKCLSGVSAEHLLLITPIFSILFSPIIVYSVCTVYCK